MNAPPPSFCHHNRERTPAFEFGMQMQRRQCRDGGVKAFICFGRLAEVERLQIDRTMGWSLRAGAIALTRIQSGAKSIASALVSRKRCDSAGIASDAMILVILLSGSQICYSHVDA
jgi:hypothetical protein